MEGEGGGSGGSRTPLLVVGGLLLLVLVGGAVVGALFGVGVLGGGGEEATLVHTPVISEQVRNGKSLVSDDQNNRVIGENVKDATAEKDRDATDMRRNRTSVNTEGSDERTSKPTPPNTTFFPKNNPTIPSTSPPTSAISSSHSYEETWPPSPRPPQSLPADSGPQV